MTFKGMTPVVFAAVLGCMHGGQRGARPATVAETDVGRLGPEQAGLVNQARQDLDVARDALSRARLGLQDARNEEGTAKAELAAAGADQKLADAQQKVANDSRAPEALERARRLQERAKANQQAAELHVEYAGKLVAGREAEVQAAERRVEVGQARVEWSRLQALEQAGNPAAAKYDAARFRAAVDEAQRKLDEATRSARSLEAQASAARQRWEGARGRHRSDGDASTGSRGE